MVHKAGEYVTMKGKVKKNPSPKVGVIFCKNKWKKSHGKLYPVQLEE
jgi:hypothetical protein